MSRSLSSRAGTGGAARHGRRAVLGAGFGAGLVLLAGCSTLPAIPGLGGGSRGTSIPDMFSLIDPALWGEETAGIGQIDDLQTFPLEIHFSRPAAIGALFEVSDDLAPNSYQEDLPRAGIAQATQPKLFTAPNIAGLPVIDSPLTSNRFRYAPEVAVLATHARREAAVWRGVEDGVFDEIEELLTAPSRGSEPPYSRGGDRLIPTEAATEHAQGRLPVVERSGQDLQIYLPEETPEIGGDGSAFDLFEDLQELIDTVDLAEAHIAFASSQLWQEGGGLEAGDSGRSATFVEWYYATELSSASEHVSRGALRVRGGEQALEDAREMLLAGGATRNNQDLAVVEAEPISEEILLVTLGSDAESPDPVGSFYDRSSSPSGPDVRLG